MAILNLLTFPSADKGGLVGVENGSSNNAEVVALICYYERLRTRNIVDRSTLKTVILLVLFVGDPNLPYQLVVIYMWHLSIGRCVPPLVDRPMHSVTPAWHFWADHFCSCEHMPDQQVFVLFILSNGLY